MLHTAAQPKRPSLPSGVTGAIRGTHIAGLDHRGRCPRRHGRRLLGTVADRVIRAGLAALPSSVADGGGVGYVTVAGGQNGVIEDHTYHRVREVELAPFRHLVAIEPGNRLMGSTRTFLPDALTFGHFCPM